MAIETLARPTGQTNEASPELRCVHHWLIEPPEGPISKGICKKCGAAKEFVNHIGFSNWESESSVLRRLGIKDETSADEGED